VYREGKIMIKLFAIALAAFSIFTVSVQTGFADNTSGARWYPFYGYRQPAYLTQRTAVTVQPAAVAAQPNGAQVYTANYPPAETTVAPSAGSYRQPSTSAEWYPFYGHRRPAYLDQ
jgi:hypothetical protein